MSGFFVYIQNIQNRTNEEKKRFALLVSLIITGIIFAFWFSAQIINRDKIIQEVGNIKIDDSTKVTEDAIKAKDTFVEIRDLIGDLKSAVSSIRN